MVKKAVKKESEQANLFEAKDAIIKVNNDWKSAEGRRFHAEYNKNKKLVLQLEKGNLSHLFLLKSSGGFWKLFSTSALYYAKVLSKRHNKSIKMHIDKDAMASYDGYVAVRNIQDFEELLAEEGAKYDAKTSPNENIRAYRLKDLILKEEIKGIRLHEKAEKEKINEIIKTKEVFPDVNYAMNEVLERIVIEYRRGASLDRNKILSRMLDTMLDIKLDFRDMCNGIIPRKEWKEGLAPKLNRLEAYIDVIMATGTLTMDAVTILVSLYSKMEQLIRRVKV